MNDNKLLLEIGTEEIPSKFMPDILKQIGILASAKLQENRVDYKNINTYGTPRRIVLYIEGVADKQRDLSELVRGPSKNIAFDSQGNATKAAIGFAKSNNVDIKDLIIKKEKGKEYIYAQKIEKGQQTQDVLKSILPKIILSINFKNSMRWSTGDIKFIRPIRWLLCLYNDSVINFELDGIKSDRKTRGHRFLGSDNVIIADVQQYFDKIRQEYVIIDPEERKSIIKDQISKIEQHINGNVLQDKDLFEEIVYITEYPTALYGVYNKQYLELPKEVVITPMKEHQRYFPVIDKNKKLMPYFIAVRNGNDKHIDIVRIGNQRVLEARLADAKFFYEQDTKVLMDKNVQKLKDIIFQEKIGTIYDKTKRLEYISCEIAQDLNLQDEQIKNVKRAAYICKADLVTEMVNEFAELQGVMGREYALYQGEHPDVAQAIYEHYLPRHASDILPKTIIGSILSIADKLDSIVGFFAIGIKPTGSQDPYALRRSALGVINIIVNNKMSIQLGKLIKIIIECYNNQFDTDFDYIKIKNEVVDFLKQRIKIIMTEMKITHDIINAVINTEFDDILNTIDKAKAVMDFKDSYSDTFIQTMTAYKRVYNITSGYTGKYEVKPELFKNDSEDKLWSAYNSIKEQIITAKANKDYHKVLKTASQLNSLINEYFNNIMVMVEDEEIKNNRLCLLKSIIELINDIIDISQIVID